MLSLLINATARPEYISDRRAKRITAIWLDAAFVATGRTANSLHFDWPHVGPVIVTRNRIEIDQSLLPHPYRVRTRALTLRAAMLHAKAEGWRAVRLEGDGNFKLRAWAMAQIMGVRVQGYAPPPGANMAGLIADLRQEVEISEITLGLDRQPCRALFGQRVRDFLIGRAAPV